MAQDVFNYLVSVRFAVLGELWELVGENDVCNAVVAGLFTMPVLTNQHMRTFFKLLERPETHL